MMIRSGVLSIPVPRLGKAAKSMLAAAVIVLMAASCGQRSVPPDDAEQVFRFRLREDPPNLDPALSTDNLSEAVVLNLFRGLVTMDPASRCNHDKGG